MTGRQLYDILTAALAEQYEQTQRTDDRSEDPQFFPRRALAWDFIAQWEKLALHAAAEQLEAIETAE